MARGEISYEINLDQEHVFNFDFSTNILKGGQESSICVWLYGRAIGDRLARHRKFAGCLPRSTCGHFIQSR